ncbi:MAG: flagellin [Mariprofundaceae bacterium]
MALTVQTNNAAITALKHLNNNNISMNRALERLSSGFRINSAADDASGYAISTKLNAQGERLKAAVQNGTQATAMVKMADAAVNEIQNMIVRIQSLAIQGASANNVAEAGKLDAERVKLEGQINKIANGTNYNGVNLLNGIDSASTGTAATAAGAVTQAGATGTHAQVTITGTPLFTEAASFTVTNAATTGFITSVVSDTALTLADGTVLFAAGVELLSAADVATPTLTPTAIVGTGLTFSAVAGTTTSAAGTATSAAATGGTDFGQAAYAGSLNFQVGDANTTDHQVAVNLQNSYTTTSLGLTNVLGDLATAAASALYIDTAIAAIDKLTIQRADLGATQNQLSFVNSNLATAIEQVSSAVSSIRDADMAAEMTNFTKSQILVQAGTSMLAQANQASQNVLSLFR